MSSNHLKKKYQEEIRSKLAKELGLKNILEVPRVEKVVVNVGIGEGSQNKGVIEAAKKDLAVITGQTAKVSLARVSIAGFNLREGAPIGLKVTLRGKRMYDFLEKLFKIVLPRLRDFQGLPLKSFDGRGNYSLGITEHTVFPEIDYSKVEKTRGLEITIVTSTSDNQKAQKLLVLLGLPLEKERN